MKITKSVLSKHNLYNSILCQTKSCDRELNKINVFENISNPSNSWFHSKIFKKLPDPKTSSHAETLYRLFISPTPPFILSLNSIPSQCQRMTGKSKHVLPPDTLFTRGLIYRQIAPLASGYHSRIRSNTDGEKSG